MERSNNQKQAKAKRSSWEMAYLIKRNAIIVRVLFNPGKPDIKGNQLESHSIIRL